jgi:hypothetical protein
MNRAEALVSRLCGNSFLSLWCYERPQGKRRGSELCDILVVCGPDVIIVSVKEIGLTQSASVDVDWDRWRRQAIQESCKQTYGAERQVRNSANVVTREGKEGLALPDPSIRRIHRVAVAFGGRGEVPMHTGDFGKGFVHVFDEASLHTIMTELDTISDFVRYLDEKEALCARARVMVAGEENLLALYLHKDHTFPSGGTDLIIDDTLWSAFKNKQGYSSKKQADEVSYVWDRLIEVFCRDYLKGDLEFGTSLSEVEMATRVMAREDRFARRILGKHFKEFMDLAAEDKVRSRKMQSPSGVVYVFLACPHGEDRQYRMAELGLRCFVARGVTPRCTTVIGVATEQYVPGTGFSLNLHYLQLDSWTAEQQAFLKGAEEVRLLR